MTIAWAPRLFWRSASRLAIWNDLVSMAGSRIPLRDEAWAVFQPAAPPPAGVPLLSLKDQDGTEVLARFRFFPFPAMFEAALAMEDFPVLPHHLCEALSEGMATMLLDALPAGGFAYAGRHPDTSSEPGAGREWFLIAVHGLAPEPIEFELGIGREALLDLLSGFAIARQEVWEGLAQYLTVPGEFGLGSIRLSMGEAAAIAPGSLVVMPEGDPDGVRLTIAGLVFDFLPSDDGLVCMALRDIEAEQRDEPHGVLEMDQETLEEAPPNLDRTRSVPVTLEFDLQRVNISLAELEGWQVGSIVAMAHPLRENGVEVTIRANGAIVGSGDLVRIDDRLAVRVTRLSF